MMTKAAAIGVAVTTVWMLGLQPARADLADGLVGTWEAALPSGVVEQLTLQPLGANGEGLAHDRQAAGSQVAEKDGRWHIRTNPLMPAQARTQLEIALIDPNWGRQDTALAILELTGDNLMICSVYLDSQCTTFRRAR